MVLSGLNSHRPASCWYQQTGENMDSLSTIPLPGLSPAARITAASLQGVQSKHQPSYSAGRAWNVTTKCKSLVIESKSRPVPEPNSSILRTWCLRQISSNSRCFSSIRRFMQPLSYLLHRISGDNFLTVPARATRLGSVTITPSPSHWSPLP